MNAFEDLCLLFPGQGSQYPAMIRRLPSSRRTSDIVEEASETSGLPLARLMTSGTADELADPLVAQLSVFAASAAYLAELSDRGANPTVVAGHSLGEVTALYAAGVLAFGDALRLVDARGRLMAEAARRQPGSMAAIMGMRPQAVEELVAELNDGVVVANRNSSRQMVLSGPTEALGRIMDRARDGGAIRVSALPVGGAYHSPSMVEANTAFRAVVEATTFHPLRLTLVSSVTGDRILDHDSARIGLIDQMIRPVEWMGVMATLSRLGVVGCIEVGPGRVLGSLAKSDRSWPRVQTIDQVLAAERITL